MPTYATVYAVIRGIAPAMRTLALDLLTNDAGNTNRDSPGCGEALAVDADQVVAQLAARGRRRPSGAATGCTGVLMPIVRPLGSGGERC